MGQSINASLMDPETKRVLTAIQEDLANLHAVMQQSGVPSDVKAAKTSDAEPVKLAELKSAP
jgi:phosphoribosylamine-glycine ligase